MVPAAPVLPAAATKTPHISLTNVGSIGSQPGAAPPVPELALLLVVDGLPPPPELLLELDTMFFPSFGSVRSSCELAEHPMAHPSAPNATIPEAAIDKRTFRISVSRIKRS
jgi:hypothetical protein